MVDHTLFERTDKKASGYVPTYEGLARTLPKDLAICEVGVFKGGSLELWQALFPNASAVVGVDSNPNATWPEGTFQVISDQGDPALPERLQVLLAKEALGQQGFGLVVDDASHLGNPTYKTFIHLWPLVRPGGYYVIEDWLVGFDMYPAYDSSMLSMAMMLLNLFEDPETDVHFITYSAGLIVIRKKEQVQ